MSGFKNVELNQILKKDIYEDMIDFIFVSLEQMKKDLLLQGEKLQNDENKIRTHLLENYLNNSEFRQKVNFEDLYLAFNAENVEGYNKESEEYIGRVDIKVYSFNTIISNNKNYYIIECKRLDGSKQLNEKFVIEGICRFVLDKPKYSSFNNENIMLGFFVKNINIDLNTDEINKIQKENQEIHIIQEMHKCRKDKEEYYLYRSKYRCGYKQIELSHIFYNLYEVIK